MSRFIEFTTSPKNPHTRFALGSPVHDGKRPPRFRETRGVRVDGQPVEFKEPEVVDSLARAIVEGRALKRQGIAFNCVTFVALLHDIKPKSPSHNPFLVTDIRAEINPLSTSVDVPLNLGRLKRYSDHADYSHVVSPAHFVDKANYLHKLGDEGPICMSGLEDVMRMYKATVADPVVLSRS